MDKKTFNYNSLEVDIAQFYDEEAISCMRKLLKKQANGSLPDDEKRYDIDNVLWIASRDTQILIDALDKEYSYFKGVHNLPITREVEVLSDLLEQIEIIIDDNSDFIADGLYNRLGIISDELKFGSFSDEEKEQFQQLIAKVQTKTISADNPSVVFE